MPTRVIAAFCFINRSGKVLMIAIRRKESH